MTNPPNTPTAHLTIMQTTTRSPGVEWLEAIATAPSLDDPKVWAWLAESALKQRDDLTWVHVSTDSDMRAVENGGASLAVEIPKAERDALDAAIAAHEEADLDL